MASIDDPAAELSRTLVELHQAELNAKAAGRGSPDEEHLLRRLSDLRRRVHRLVERLEEERQAG